MKNTKTNISLEQLHPFEGHPYKVQDNEEMESLTESIRQNGILSPLLVRPKDGQPDHYEVISGHRRLYAAKKAGLETVPALIYAIDREAAAILLVDSNLHREHILPSEKAFAYKMKAEALNHRGFRSDLTSVQIAPKLATEQIAEDVGTSKDTIKRYIRLTHLIPEFLDKMDEGKMALSVGVELSYLDETIQREVLEQCEINDCTPSYSQAFRLHKADREGLLSPPVLRDIMTEEKANQREMFKLPMERIRQFVPNANPKQAEDFVLKACEHYRKFLIRQRSRDER